MNEPVSLVRSALSASLLVLVAGLSAACAASSGTRLTILYTSNMKAVFTPCG